MKIISRKILIFISSLAFCSGFLLFSSTYSFNLPFPYPFLFYTLASVWILGLFLSFQNKTVNSLKTQKEVYILFSLLIAMGILSSLYFQTFSLLAVLSKITTIFICLASFTLGNLASKNRDTLNLFADYIMLFSLIGFGISLIDSNLNKNWVGLLVAYSLIFKSYTKNYSPLIIVTTFSFSAIVILITLSARGVTLLLLTPSLIILIFIITKKLNNDFFNKSIYLTGLLLFLLSLTAPLIGSLLYDTNLYWELNSVSRDLYGKNLDSSRLERWEASITAAINDSPILGFGIDAAMGRLLDVEGGAAHNLWVEVFFRFGVIGLIFYIGFFLWIFKKISKKNKFYGGITMIAFSTSSSVYGVGGFTHWPGTFAFWFLLSILAYSRSIDRK